MTLKLLNSPFQGSDKGIFTLRLPEKATGHLTMSRPKLPWLQKKGGLLSRPFFAGRNGKGYW
jgi:hypothetical protein